ncbi:M14 family metallopeptidase [[Eubacterium] cellulosolvens]
MLLRFSAILTLALLSLIIIISISPIIIPQPSARQPELQDDAYGLAQILGGISTASRAARGEYSYHNYSTLTADLKKLNNTYPDLFELDTAQQLFGLPDCKDGYKIWILRVTNEKLGFNKPEVLFLGGHHGDEDISIEAPYYLAEFLLQNYATNSRIRYLLDHREIYIVPVVNPWGWENHKREDYNGEDVNRDYPYGIAAGNTPLTTVGARSVAELMKRHIFILSLTWHSGNHLIYYAWGTPKHDTPSDESPDNIAFFEVSKLMSNYAGGQTKYPFGPANQIIYYADGAWSDYAYAANWDTEYLFSGYETPGARSLAIGVEISNTKIPDQALLGKSEEVSNPDTNIGYIPQNIRMALVMIDLAEPYLAWNKHSSTPIPTEVKINTNLTLDWWVNGTFSVTETRLLYGTDPDPVNNYQYNTSKLSGGSVWSDEAFSQKITVPNQPGDYYIVAQAIVDQSSVVQVTPEPDIPPQSFFVNQRINDSWSTTINGNTLKGNKNWYSQVLHIKVIEEEKNEIQITNYTKPAYCNEMFNIIWEAKLNQPLNLSSTQLFWGENPNPVNNSNFNTMPNSMSIDIDRQIAIYYANFTLPAKPGNYYFSAQLKLDNNTTLWSQILQLEIKPKIPYELQVSVPKIEYINGYQQTLSLQNIRCINNNISTEPLNDSLMNFAQAKITAFDFESKEILPSQEITFDLEWSKSDNYWRMPVKNVSSWNPGWYLVTCKFKHKYGVGQSLEIINDEKKNWFKLEHIIVVSKPTVKLINNDTKKLNIHNITAWCSKRQLDGLDISEVLSHSYTIYTIPNNKPVLDGDLNWSSTDQTWYAFNVAVESLEPGDYYVICNISVAEVGVGKSVHATDDETEFSIQGEKKGDEKDQRPISDEYWIIMTIVLVFIIIILIFIILFARIRKKS